VIIICVYSVAVIYIYVTVLYCCCRSAKEKQLRIWKDYQPPVLPASVPIKTKEFIAKVIITVSMRS